MNAKNTLGRASYKQTLQNSAYMATLGEDESLDSMHSNLWINDGTEGIQAKTSSKRSSRPPINISINSVDRTPTKSKLRESLYETDNGELFSQTIQVRSKTAAFPTRRGLLSVMQWGKSESDLGSSLKNIPQDQKDTEGDVRKQYSISVKKKTSTYRKIINLVYPDEFVYSPSKFVLWYINWIFKSNVSTVTFSFIIVFIVLCLVFALLLFLAGNTNPECIIIGGETYGTQSSTRFSDSFHLSWTTFTTVGYGGAYAATGTEHADQWECAFVTALCTLESFAGLLYAGFCTAILFSKIQRIQSHAQVSFSNAICVQLPTFVSTNTRVAKNEGDGSTRNNVDDSLKIVGENVKTTSNSSQDESDATTKLSCPILKFQLINELANVPGGDILDAHINVVGRRDATSTKEAVARYVRVRMQESNHPFFTRVWHCTHVLNENSRLLSPQTRKAIAANNGFWPDNMSTPQEIEEALKFDKIIITLTGICDLSATPVQIAKRYNKHDVLIGYDFAPMVYKVEGMSNLRVDFSLMHDIIEQYGTQQHSLLLDINYEDTHRTVTQRNSESVRF